MLENKFNFGTFTEDKIIYIVVIIIQIQWKCSFLMCFYKLCGKKGFKIPNRQVLSHIWNPELSIITDLDIIWLLNVRESLKMIFKILKCIFSFLIETPSYMNIDMFCFTTSGLIISPNKRSPSVDLQWRTQVSASDCVTVCMLDIWPALPSKLWIINHACRPVS